MKNFILVTLIAILCASCFGVHHGSFQSSAQLTENNYKIVKRNAQGKASTVVVLWIGGLSKEAMVAEAKQNLMKANNVTDTQLLVNVSVDWQVITTPAYFIAWQNTCTVTADIIEFTK